MNKKAFLIVLLYTFCPSVFGQDNSWPLQKCIAEAMKNSIEIKLQQLSVKKAQKEHNSLVNQMLPSVSFTGNQSYNFGSTIDPSTNGRVSSNIQNDNFYLNAQMNLIDFKAFATAQKTKIDIEKSKAQLAVIENEYQLQILESYYQALFTQELLKIQKEQFKNSQFNLDRVQKEVSIGSKPKSDLYDMQLSFAQEEMKIMETEQLSVLQKTQLFQLMNVENISVAEVVLDNFIGTNNLAETTAISNPKIKFAELNYQSSQKETKLERANNLPSLTTYYGFSTFYYKPLNQPDVIVDNFNKQISDNKNHQVGIQLNVPVFNGFRNNKRVSATKIESEKSKFVIEQEKLKVKNQIDIENQNKNNYAQLYAKLQQMKTFAEASFRTSQAKFTSGTIDAVVFSAVKNQWLSTEYDLLKNELQQQYIALKISLIQGNVL
ncbi:TolC family protein [Flavobacterium sp. 102]|uniref:TolC family protein n=1 Tax=Flavobacterium sp. 102 TaxID=2135623 RepID=UPI000EAE2F5F|nr:TolC family protein [Flavobacterium sp. 102]RKS01423.1 outer membrane protein [Flavobacterium sp. 102]